MNNQNDNTLSNQESNTDDANVFRFSVEHYDWDLWVWRIERRRGNQWELQIQHYAGSRLLAEVAARKALRNAERGIFKVPDIMPGDIYEAAQDELQDIVESMQEVTISPGRLAYLLELLAEALRLAQED